MALLLLIAVGGVVCRAQSSTADEAQIRAAMLFNLTRFVDWPAEKMGSAQAPFVIGYIGDDAVGNGLNNLMRGKQVQGKSILVQNISSAAQTAQCHILYVANSGRKQYKQMAPELSKAAVLIVSERQLGDNGIVIGLPLVDTSIQIQVDLKMAQYDGLTISSKLLRIAAVTR
jgi:phosphohistidine swiveling domain-containing protein